MTPTEASFDLELDLRQLADVLLRETCQRFPLGYIPEVEWRGLRVTAGVAYYQVGKIALSKHVIRTPEQLKVTFLHEYAHLLAFKRAGRKGTGHGSVWKQAMLDLGVKPDIHHKYEVKRNKNLTEVVYRCKKCGAVIVRKRRLNHRRKYLHIRCHGSIEFVESRNAIQMQ